MKLYRKNLVICAALSSLITIFSVSCGGGSGKDARNVSGNWSGALSLTTSTCPRSTPKESQEGIFNHTVNQNEDAVILQDSNGVQFLGNTVGDNGFSVNAILESNVEIDGSTQCDISQQIEYNGIESNSDTTADVTLITTTQCSDQTSCEQRSRGAATRISASPTPVPTSEPEPAFNGCQDVREIPFEGDGGCGILASEFTFDERQDGTYIVLEPFGSNEATSFLLSETDPFMASSLRTDLTIGGESGYRCSVQCEGRFRFALMCFKEGAESCEEVF